MAAPLPLTMPTADLHAYESGFPAESMARHVSVVDAPRLILPGRAMIRLITGMAFGKSATVIVSEIESTPPRPSLTLQPMAYVPINEGAVHAACAPAPASKPAVVLHEKEIES